VFRPSFYSIKRTFGTQSILWGDCGGVGILYPVGKGISIPAQWGFNDRKMSKDYYV